MMLVEHKFTSGLEDAIHLSHDRVSVRHRTQDLDTQHCINTLTSADAVLLKKDVTFLHTAHRDLIYSLHVLFLDLAFEVGYEVHVVLDTKDPGYFVLIEVAELVAKSWSKFKDDTASGRDKARYRSLGLFVFKNKRAYPDPGGRG